MYTFLEIFKDFRLTERETLIYTSTIQEAKGGTLMKNMWNVFDEVYSFVDDIIVLIGVLVLRGLRGIIIMHSC